MGINCCPTTEQAFLGTRIPMLLRAHSLLVPWTPSDLFGLLESPSVASEQTPAFCQVTGPQLSSLDSSAQATPTPAPDTQASYSRISGGETQRQQFLKLSGRSQHAVEFESHGASRTHLCSALASWKTNGDPTGLCRSLLQAALCQALRPSLLSVLSGRL